MATTTTATTSGNTSFGGLLFIAFLVLRLTHVIDWSWWWVTAPLWIPTTFVLALVAITFSIAAIASVRK